MSKQTDLTTLSDSALIALFMRARNGHTAEQRATYALDEIGTLRKLLANDQRDDDRLSRTERTQLQAALELARRYTFETMSSRDVMSSPRDVREYLSLKLSGLEHEVFAAIFLDNRHRVIEYSELFTGTIDSAAVYPREIVKHCLSRNAAAVIFAHNHPSGQSAPSDTDVRLTRKLTDALSLIDVRVLDHLVIGAGCITSLAERGLM